MVQRVEHAPVKLVGWLLFNIFCPNHFLIKAVSRGISATTIRVINSILSSQAISPFVLVAIQSCRNTLKNLKAIFTIFAHRITHVIIQRVQQKNIARAANELCVVVVLYANQDDRMQHC